MTQIVCPVVEVTKWGKHPNADTLSITQVFGNTVIFRTEEFVKPCSVCQNGTFRACIANPDATGIEDSFKWSKDPCPGCHGESNKSFRAVFIPEEALVPEEPRWAFLWAGKEKDCPACKGLGHFDCFGCPICNECGGKKKVVREKDRVVKAKKIRGIFSCGILIPIPTTEWYAPCTGKTTVGPTCDIVGTDLAPALGITKFEKPEEVGTGGDNESAPSWLRRYTDIENARGPLYRGNQLSPAERGLGIGKETAPDRHTALEGLNVIITEKIHGANARYCWREDKFWVGSHNNAKDLDSVNIWTHAAKKHNLEEICKCNPGLLLFGEVFGQVQKGYDYGRKGPEFVLFDILDLFLGAGPEWLKWDQVKGFAAETGLQVVPELYRGPWVSLEHAATFADGPTVLGNGKHNREGCVVKADPEAWNEFLGRVVVKVIGEEYLLKKYS